MTDYFYEFELGTTQGNMVNVESLNSDQFNPPQSTFTKYVKEAELGNATVRGQGYSLATWKWFFMAVADWITLKTYCPNKSALLYIRTKDEQQAYHTYYGVLIWPKEEPRDAGVYTNLTLQFRLLQQLD